MDNQAARTKGHDAWTKWWQNQEGKIDLAKKDTELFFADTQQRCKEVARHFFNSILNLNFALWQKSTDVPFNFVGRFAFGTATNSIAFTSKCSRQ